MRVNISHSLFNSTRLECITKNNINATSPVDRKKKTKLKQCHLKEISFLLNILTLLKTPTYL